MIQNILELRNIVCYRRSVGGVFACFENLWTQTFDRIWKNLKIDKNVYLNMNPISSAFFEFDLIHINLFSLININLSLRWCFWLLPFAPPQLTLKKFCFFAQCVWVAHEHLHFLPMINGTGQITLSNLPALGS